MKKEELLQANGIISQIKLSGASPEALAKIVKLKMAITAEAKSVFAARDEIEKNLYPDGFSSEEGEMQKQHQEVLTVLKPILAEEIKINTKILSEDEFFGVIAGRDITAGDAEYLFGVMVKTE